MKQFCLSIIEDYCSFEVAKLLKEKGFDTPTRFVWYEKLPYDLAIKPGTFNKPGIDLYFMSKATEHNSLFDNKDKANYIEGAVYSCPTQSIALKWLREVHNIFIEIKYVPNQFTDEPSYKAMIWDMSEEIGRPMPGDIEYMFYETCVNDALKYTLENLI